MKQAERSKPHLRPENALDALRRVLGATTVAGVPGGGAEGSEGVLRSRESRGGGRLSRAICYFSATMRPMT